jgi:hypothetical protein
MFPTELYVLDDFSSKMCENICKLLQFKEVFDMIVKLESKSPLSSFKWKRRTKVLER